MSRHAFAADDRSQLLPLEVRSACLSLDGRGLLNSLSFRLEGARVTVVLGPNGSGKSLLLRCLHGVQALDSGEIDWNGLNPDRARARQGMVFQQPVMLRRSVAGNLKFALKARAISRSLHRQRIGQALELAGMTDLALRPARKLSGGETQRLAIARVWACEPLLMLLDEPCASLDPYNSREVERMIRRLADSGTPVIMATHDLGQARRLADEILFMASGTIVEQAPASAFFSDAGPATPLAAAFLQGELVL